MTTITALTDLSKLPNQSQDQAVFDANFAYLVENLPLRAQQENALAANLNSIAAGGAYAIPFTFMPYNYIGGGLGYLTFTNGAASQSAATSVFTDLRDARLASITALLSSFVGSSSQTKGHLRIVKVGDPSKYLVFSFTAASQNGYTQTHVGACVDSSSANPFAYGDSLLVYFQRTGDKGDTGPMPVYPYAEFTEQHASGVSANGGAIATGTYDRNLNTTVANGMGAVLSGGSFTLQAGTYDFEAIACAVANSSSHNKVVLQNTTDNTNIVGTGTVMTGSTSNIFSSVGGRFTITAPKTYKLRTWIGPVGTLPGQSLSSGYPEIYAQIKLWKLA